MGFFDSLATGLGFGGGVSTGFTLVDRYLQPPRSRMLSSQAIGRTTLTIMQVDAWGQQPRYELYAIWDGEADLMGTFDSWPKLQAGFQTIGVYLKMGGDRDHFWTLGNLPPGAPIPPIPNPVIDYPDDANEAVT